MQNIQPKQISKVAYEAIRAYAVTIGEPERKSWEATVQGDRDATMNKVDALLSGTPHAPDSIRPSDQVKAKLLAGIVGAFVQVYNPPVQQVTTFVQPEPPPPPIPVETFPNPDDLPAAGPKPVEVLAAQGAEAAKANEVRAEEGKPPVPIINVVPAAAEAPKPAEVKK